MDEATRAGHPETAELQAHADGELQDERVARHVESCAACRDGVAAARRVTAALALGSRPSDTLMTRIQAKRAGAASAPSRAIRPRFRLRALAMPVGLAAAAALAIIVPRMREPIRDETPSASGAKGVFPRAVFETLLRERKPASLDSVFQAAQGRGMIVELRYSSGNGESKRAEDLVNRITWYLGTERRMDPAKIEVRSDETDPLTRRIPPGAVHITVRPRF